MHIFISLFCYLIYVGAIYSFCAQYLKNLTVNKKVFVVFLFCGGILLNYFRGWTGIPYISILFNYVLYILWLFVAFKENAEKKMLTAVIFVLKKALITVFENETRSWYFMLSKLLFSLVIIVEVVNWGASNGIMVVSNANGAEYWNIYHNQIFSHVAICLLTVLVMCIACGLIFGMNKIYMDQRKAVSGINWAII